MIALPSSQTLSRRNTSWLWALYALPLAIPAPLYAVGMIHLWNRHPAIPLYGSSFMLLLTHVGRFLPYAVFALVAQLRQVDSSLHEAARLHRETTPDLKPVAISGLEVERLIHWPGEPGSAQVTLENNTEQERSVRLAARIEGGLGQARELPEQTVTIGKKYGYSY